MAVNLSPIWGAGAQLLDNSGNVLSGGKIYTYAAGTTTPATTYTNSIGTVANSNPIVANAAGRLTNEIWFPVGGSYKFVLKDANDVLLATYDNIPTTPQPPIVNDASSISYETGYIVDAGNFTVGATYLITSVGTTDFVAIGAAANVTGIHFTATGIGSGTGTAEYSRTVQDKLRETVSVKDFGAVGDGVTDDTVAIQAALTASNNVTFPDGSYLISSGITKTDDNVTIDFGNATIINGGAGYTFTFGVLDDTYQNEGLTIIGGYFTQSNPSTASNLNYILVQAIKNFTIKDCVMSNVSNGGITVYAGAQDGVIDNVKITGISGYRTCRGIWLNGSTASDYAIQLVDISSITRNATPVPVYAVKNVKVCNCTIVLPYYGVYNMNTRDTHIENCYIDVSGGGGRCIAINNYSPGAIIEGNTFKSDQASTGILVTQFSHDVIIDGNTFLGSFGGGRDIYVQYLADCQITNNKFNTDSTQQILINMGATAVIRGNYFNRLSGVSANVRCVLFTTIDEAAVGTSTYGNTATTLAGITFADNVVKNRLSVVNVRANTAANGNIPGLDTVNVRNNIMYNFDSVSGVDEYGLKITAPGTTYKIAYSYFDNTVYPAANANRNTVSVTGTGYTAIRTDIQYATFSIVNAASGGAVTSSKLFGGNFSCAASRSSNDLLIAPRTINGAFDASVATPVGITDVNGNMYTYSMHLSGTSFVLKLFDSAGTQIPLSTTAAAIYVTITGTAT